MMRIELKTIKILHRFVPVGAYDLLVKELLSFICSSGSYIYVVVVMYIIIEHLVMYIRCFEHLMLISSGMDTSLNKCIPTVHLGPFTHCII